MNFDDEIPIEGDESGSDELLSDDHLRLPDSANPLVRLHAVRAWLTRRQKEMTLEIGETALTWQALQEEMTQDSSRLRRREQQHLAEQLQKAEQAYQLAQAKLSTFEEAEQLLEECLSHTTSSERTLVEYYLTLDNLIQQDHSEEIAELNTRDQVFTEVQHRVEQVGTPQDD